MKKYTLLLSALLVLCVYYKDGGHTEIPYDTIDVYYADGSKVLHVCKDKSCMDYGFNPKNLKSPVLKMEECAGK